MFFDVADEVSYDLIQFILSIIYIFYLCTYV